MGNSDRPLRNLSDDELIQLWRMAVKIDDMAQDSLDHIEGFSSKSLMTPEDVVSVRAGIILQVKLCQKYGIPFPPIYLKFDESTEEVLREGLDEEEFESGECIFEWENGDLHRTMDRFASVDGIGDFIEEELFYDKDDLEPLLNEEEGAEEKVKDFLDDELTYAGYREIISFIRQNDPEMLEVNELRVAKSKKMALLSDAVAKGKVPPAVGSFWNNFSVKLIMRTYRWVPINNSEEVKDDEWRCVYTIMNHYEGGVLICDLYKFMCTRVGAFIAQEFAERYCCAAAA